MQVFYVNIGGGEPTVRPDFWELVDYATAHHVGVKFSTNGVKITPEVARRLAASDYVDVQISLDGATAEVNDAVRGAGSYATAVRAMENLADAGFTGFKISVVVTRHNVGQLDDFKAHRRPLRRAAAAHPAAPVRPRRRRLGRAAPDRGAAARALRLAARARRERADRRLVLPPGRLRRALPGLNLCGAGRVVCLIDPVGDVYACPFAIHDNFLAGNVRAPGGFAASGGSRSCSPTCAGRRPAAPARPARPSTPAAAAAWRRSSSPACRSTARTRSASRATARRRWPRPSRRRAAAVRRPLTRPRSEAGPGDRSERPPAGRGDRSRTGRATRARSPGSAGGRTCTTASRRSGSRT